MNAVYGCIRGRAPEVTVQEIEKQAAKWVRTHDGRLLEYFVAGAEDGIPMYFQHSFGQTGRQVMDPELIATAKGLGLKMIGPSMPGFGYSSSLPLGVVRRLKDWPDDVRLILEAEKGFDKFYVSGYSAGCIHAAVVGHRFADRVLGISLFAPTTTLAEEANMGGLAPSVLFLRRTLPKSCTGDCLGYLMGRCMTHEKRLTAAPDCKAAIDIAKKMPEGSYMKRRLQDALDDGERGTAKTWRGWCDNMHVLNEDMPFKAGELSVLTKSHGKAFIVSSAADDLTNPPAMQKWWATHVEGVELMEVAPGWGHMHFFEEGVNHSVWEAMMRKSATQ